MIIMKNGWSNKRVRDQIIAMIHFHFLLSWFFCIIHFLSSHDLVSNSFVWFTFTFYHPVICSQNFLYYSLLLFIILWFGLKHFCMIHFHFLSSHDLLPDFLYSRGWEKFDGGQTRAFGFESTRPTKPKLTILHPPVSPPHHPNNTKITPILEPSISCLPILCTKEAW